MARPAGYNSWREMIRRCTVPHRREWARYGGRGIEVCERWRFSFENFMADMGPRPSSRHSIDRYPNNNGNYEPGNCRWATKSQQALNTRKVVMPGATNLRGKWQAQIDVAGKNIYLGLFPTCEEASAAFLLAKAIRDGESAP